MRQRKQVMEDRADAFVTLPGGIGTLELFETWTAGWGMHDKPVVLLDPGGHYDGLFGWLDGLRAAGVRSRRPRWMIAHRRRRRRRTRSVRPRGYPG